MNILNKRITHFDGGVIVLLALVAVGAFFYLRVGEYVINLDGSLWRVAKNEVQALEVRADNEVSVSGVGRQGFHRKFGQKGFAYIRAKTIYFYDVKAEKEERLFTPVLSRTEEDVLLFGWNSKEERLGYALWYDPPDDGGSGGVDPPPVKRFHVLDVGTREVVRVNPDGTVWGWVDESNLLVTKLRFEGSTVFTDFFAHDVRTDATRQIGERNHELLNLVIDPTTNGVSILEVQEGQNVLSQTKSISYFEFSAIASRPFARIQNVKVFKHRTAFVEPDNPADLSARQDLVVGDDVKYSCDSSIRYEWTAKRRIVVQCQGLLKILRV